VVHDLHLPAHVLDVVAVDELPRGDGLAGEALAGLPVRDEVGDPELAPAELAPEGVGRADVLHGAAQHPPHPGGGGRGRRGGIRLLLLLLMLPLPSGMGSLGLRRLRRPGLLGLRAVMLLLVVMLRCVGPLVVRLGAVAGGSASHGGRSGAGAQSVEWGGAGKRGRRRRA